MNHSRTFIKQNIIVDTHLDLLYDVEMQRRLGRRKVIIEDYMEDFKAGGINIVVSSLFVDNDYLPEKALPKAMAQVACLYDEIKESENTIMLVKSYEDIEEAIKTGKVGIMLSFEGIEPIHKDIRMLRIFYELGVRIVGLNWSRGNSASDGCKYDDFMYIGYGLTEFGEAVVDYAQELGMIIDVSHMNEKSFWDVLRRVKNPVIASHSNCRGINDTPRNLNDAQIKAIRNNGGVICFNSCNILVAHDNENATISQFVKHIKYAKKKTSNTNLGLGFDMCNRILKFSPAIKTINFPVFDSFNGHAQMIELVNEMKVQGFSDEDIKNVLGKNVLSIFKQVLK